VASLCAEGLVHTNHVHGHYMGMSLAEKR
jgi:hypothetical protein